MTDPFPDTLWTQIIERLHPFGQAEQPGCTEEEGHEARQMRDEAWRAFLDAYHAPIQATLRALQRHHPVLAGEDLVPDFFTYLFETAVTTKAERAPTAFRRFIQGVARRFVLGRMSKAVRSSNRNQALPPDTASGNHELDDVWADELFGKACRRLRRVNSAQARALAEHFSIPAAIFGLPEPPSTDPPEAAPSAKLVSLARTGLNSILRHLIRDTTSSPDAMLDEYRVVRDWANRRWPGILD